jgi:activator of 2-hydroxyglutaryl-CoA dehydratase
VNYYPQLPCGCLKFATGTGVNEQVGLLEDMVLAGGCAKNESLSRALEQRLRVKMKTLPMNPQIVGAVGAALIVTEKGQLV